MNRTKILNTALSISLILLAIIKGFNLFNSEYRIDIVLISLIIAAFLFQLVPFERLKSFKAGGFEVSLDNPQIQAAISIINTQNIENEHLKKKLNSLIKEIEISNNSRILWIDDKQYTILKPRKLLRALGVNIITAESSEIAENILKYDQDFDLIITDVQRKGVSYKLNNGIDIHEGVNFIVKIRNSDDTILKNIHVVFYGAYDWERLVEFTRPAREIQPEPDITNTVNELISKVIIRLSEIRSNKIAYLDDKERTDP